MGEECGENHLDSHDTNMILPGTNITYQIFINSIDEGTIGDLINNPTQQQQDILKKWFKQYRDSKNNERCVVEEVHDSLTILQRLLSED